MTPVAPLLLRTVGYLIGVSVFALPGVAGPATLPTRAPVSDAVPALPPSAVTAAVGAFRSPLAGSLVVLRRLEPPAITWGAGHRGVDLGAGVGEAVLAPANGVITFAGRIVDRSVVVVSHGPLRSTFEPVAAVLPVGTVVRAGQPVGTLTAEAGHCMPVSCLHWGVLRGDTYLDPLALLAPPSVRLWPMG